MHADFDLDEGGNATPIPQKPRGRGRPVGYSQTRARLAAEGREDPDADPEDVTGTAIRKARAQARKEEAQAGREEIKLKVESGEYLPRAAFRDACATLLATVAQSMRSIPDNLERKCNLNPDAMALVEKTIDKAMEELALGLEMFTEGGE